MNTFAAVAEKIGEVGELLVERVKVEPGMDVLDVATGTGNVALAAAKEGARVIGLEREAELLELARERAADAMIELDWMEGQPEALPFEDSSFDRVLSAFGSMFAPRPRKAAAELLRVCRPGGAIGMCNWTPDGVGGRMYSLLDDTPSLWGSEEQLRELFGGRASDLRMERRSVTFEERSPEAWLEFLSQSLAPFDAELSPERRRELVGLFEEANQADGGGLRFEQEYLLAVARL